MRRQHAVIAGVAVVALAAAGLVVGGALRASGEPSAAAVMPPASAATPFADPTPLPTQPSAVKTPMLAPAQNVLVLGDSLALSTYAWLADLMPDRVVTWEAEVGRGTPQSQQLLLQRAEQSLPPVILVSSGTNDLDDATLGYEAARIIDIAGPNRCVIWADIQRPATYGDSTEAMNAALDRAIAGHPNVSVVRWSAMVAAHPDWLTGDGIHPREEGNRARAQAFADAVFACSPLDPDAPVAAKEYLPPSAFLAPGGGSAPGVGPAPVSSSSPPRSTPKPSPTRASPSAPAPTASTPPPSSPPPETPPPPSTPSPTSTASAGPSAPPGDGDDA